MAEAQPPPSRVVDPDDKNEAGTLEDVEAIQDSDKAEAYRVSEAELTPEQKKEEARMLRKLDWRLVPIVSLIYSVSGLDRVNLSNARVAGMNEDLGFNIGNRYSIALLTFFITYFLFEMPTVLSLRWIGPKYLLNGLTVCFGAVMLGMGWANDWRVVVVCRLLIGVFEAGLLPCSMFLLSSWYQRYEVQKRMAFWYMINLFVTGFGSILAYVIVKLDGAHGIEGWRWIFIVEGAATLGVAVIGYLVVLPFPDQMLASGKYQGFTRREIELVLDRIERDRGDSRADKLTFKKVLHEMFWWPLWVYGLMFLSCSAPIYAFAYFIQIILTSMGYTLSTVYLLCTPPYICSMLVTYLVAWAADRSKVRMPFMAANAVITFVGLLLVAYCKNNAVRYFGVFLGVSGCNANLPTIVAFQANNVISASRRSVANGVQFFFAAIGGIYASCTFMQKEYPIYTTGVWCAVATQFMLLMLIALMTWYFRWRNGQANRGEYAIQGDPSFRYTY